MTRTVPLLFALAAITLAPDTAAKNVEKDKSKPVRAALTARYAEIVEAYRHRDADAVMRSRLPDWFAVQVSGEVWGRDKVEGYTRAAMAQVETTLVLEFDLGTIDVHGDTAAVDLGQHWVRRQQKGGQLRLVETRARQRETWIRESGAWWQWRVDRVVPGAWIVDGKRIDPSKPYDPDAPEYVPEGDGR